MKAVIEKGKIYIPEEIRGKMNLSDNCECEILISESEIKIKIKDKSKDIDDDPILSLVGLGKEIWEGVNPDEYVRNLRKSWE